MLDKKKLIEIAEGFGIEIIFEQPEPHGVYDDVDGTFSTYQELFKGFTNTNNEVKYQVEWEHHQTNTYSKHGIFNTFEDALVSICEWWEGNDFTPSYIRMWTEDRVTTIDYGFRNMFYYIVEGIFKED